MTYGLAKCARRACGKPFTRKTYNQEYCTLACQRLFHDKPKGAMHFSKLSRSAPLQRVHNLLKKGPQTTKQIERLARVSNPATWVSMLRKNGINALNAQHIKTNKDGTKVYRYELAKTTFIGNGRSTTFPGEATIFEN